MGISFTWTTLKAAIVAISEDTSDDLADNLATIIGLAEVQALRDLDLEIFQQTIAAGTLTIGSQAFTRPTDLIKANHIWLTSGVAKKRVKRRTLAYCTEYSADTSAGARDLPKYYAENGEDAFFFTKCPDAAYVVTIQGIKRPTGLSGSTADTWLSKYAGDALLYACLVQAEKFLTNPDQVDSWKGDYQDRIAKAKLELRGMTRATYEAARMVGQPATPL